MDPIIIIPLLLISGLLIGIIVNYLSDVLPANRRLSKPVCLNCLTEKSWIHFLSFKPCQNCGRKVSFRTIVIPFIFMALTTFLYFFPGQRLGFWPNLLLFTFFAIVLINDLEYRVVLFQVSIAGLLICAVFGYFLHGIVPTILGGLAGFVMMYLLYLGGGWFTKFLSKRRGEPIDQVALGFGDVSISTVIGLLLGWPVITAGLLLGIFAGGLFSVLFLLVMLILRRYQPLTALPYTPFLVLGAIVLLFAKG